MIIANMESSPSPKSGEYKFRSVPYHLHNPIHWAHNRSEETNKSCGCPQQLSKSFLVFHQAKVVEKMMYVIVCLVALGASFLTLFSGFGLSTLLMPAFALFFPLEAAIAMTAVVHLANNVFKLALVGRKLLARRSRSTRPRSSSTSICPAASPLTCRSTSSTSTTATPRAPTRGGRARGVDRLRHEARARSSRCRASSLYALVGKAPKLERQPFRRLDSYGLVSTAFNRFPDLQVQVGGSIGTHAYFFGQLSNGNPIFMRDPNALAGDNGTDEPPNPEPRAALRASRSCTTPRSRSSRSTTASSTAAAPACAS